MAGYCHLAASSGEGAVDLEAVSINNSRIRAPTMGTVRRYSFASASRARDAPELEGAHVAKKILLSSTIYGALSGLAGAITGGVAGGFGDTYDATRLLASGAAGCATGELTGGGCSSGAAAGLAVAALQWAGNAMRVNQVTSSEQFKGIQDAKTGDTVTNASGPSDGIDGDHFKLAGTRVALDDIKQYGNVMYSDGTMTFDSNLVNPATDQPWTLKDVLNKVGGATGGNQGLPGTVSGIPYEPSGFVDKLMESFAGPHDFLGSLTGYDALGNLAHVSDIQRKSV